MCLHSERASPGAQFPIHGGDEFDCCQQQRHGCFRCRHDIVVKIVQRDGDSLEAIRMLAPARRQRARSGRADRAGLHPRFWESRRPGFDSLPVQDLVPSRDINVVCILARRGRRPS